MAIPRWASGPSLARSGNSEPDKAVLTADERKWTRIGFNAVGGVRTPRLHFCRQTKNDHERTGAGLLERGQGQLAGLARNLGLRPLRSGGAVNHGDRRLRP